MFGSTATEFAADIQGQQHKKMMNNFKAKNKQFTKLYHVCLMFKPNPNVFARNLSLHTCNPIM